METCLNRQCYYCKHFKAIRNEFEHTFNCVCLLYKKGVVGQKDVTAIIPDVMLAGIDQSMTSKGDTHE